MLCVFSEESPFYSFEKIALGVSEETGFCVGWPDLPDNVPFPSGSETQKPVVLETLSFVL